MARGPKSGTRRPACDGSRVKADHLPDGTCAVLGQRARADRGPIATNLPKLGDYLTTWLAEVVKPGLAPKTCER